MIFDDELDGADRVPGPGRVVVALQPIRVVACVAFWLLSIAATAIVVLFLYGLLGAAFPG